jgi:hypothetical protein
MYFLWLNFNVFPHRQLRFKVVHSTKGHYDYTMITMFADVCEFDIFTLVIFSMSHEDHLP